MDEVEVGDGPPSLFGPVDDVPDDLIDRGWDPTDDGDASLDFDAVPDPDDEAEWLAGLPPEVRADVVASATRPYPWDADGDARPGGFGCGGFFDTMLPGWGLAQALQQVTAFGYTELDDDALAGVLRGCQRQAAWAQAGVAMAVAALTERRVAEAARPGCSRISEHVTDEVAVELTLTGRSAGRLVDLAAGLRRLAEVHDALLSGEIDWARACLFVDELSVLDDAAAAGIVSRLVEPAAGWTTGQLRAALARAVLAADPSAAQRRKRQARADTRVEVWAEPSGNSALAGRELRPTDVIAIDAQLTAYARWLQGRGVPGTLGQLRALAYTTLLSGRELAAILEHPATWPTQAADGGHPDPLPDAGASGQDDSRTGAYERAARPGGPGADHAARPGGSIHLTMPLSAWLGSGEPGEVAGHGPVDAETGLELAERLGPAARWCLTLTAPDGRAVSHACARRGPAAAEPVLRWAAGLRDRLQYLETGTCSHARQSPGYLPPAPLRHLIQVRQRSCSFPGCRRAAHRCDLDHTVPFDRAGLTCECNVSPLCRRHHRAKQVPGWQLTQDQPGVMTWKLPSGRTYNTTGELYSV